MHMRARSRFVIVRILVILSVAFMLSQFYRSVMAVIAPELDREVALSSSQLGILSASFFVAFGLMQIPVGMLLDRFGQRRTIAITLLVAMAGALWFWLGEGFVGLTAARALMGMGCSAVFMGVLVTCSRWLSPDRFGTASSVSIGIGGLGVLLATTPFVALQTAVGWRGAFLVIGLVTGATALATWLGIKDAPPGHPSHDQPRESLRDVLRGVLQVLGNRQLPYILAVAFTGYSSIMSVVGMWGGPYLDAVFGLTGVARGNVLFAMAACMITGNLLFGFLDQVVRNRKRLMLAAGSIVAAVFMTLAATSGLAVWQVTGLLMLLALANGYVALNYAQARLLFPDHMVGRALTAVNLFVFLGVAFMQTATGFLVEGLSNLGATPEAAYRAVFGMLGGLLLVALTMHSRFRAPAAALPHEATATSLSPDGGGIG